MRSQIRRMGLALANYHAILTVAHVDRLMTKLVFLSSSISHSLAWLYFLLSRHGDAEPLHKRSLAIREKALGPAHPGVAESLLTLAFFYQIMAAMLTPNRS